MMPFKSPNTSLFLLVFAGCLTFGGYLNGIHAPKIESVEITKLICLNSDSIFPDSEKPLNFNINERINEKNILYVVKGNDKLECHQDSTNQSNEDGICLWNSIFKDEDVVILTFDWFVGLRYFGSFQFHCRVIGEVLEVDTLVLRNGKVIPVNQHISLN